MGDFTSRGTRRTVAVLVVAALAVAAVVVALVRPSEQERFRSWLRDQPGIVSVDEPEQALALGVAGEATAGRVFEPTDHAVVGPPLDVTLVDRLGRAIVGYAAAHPSLANPTVELRRGSDLVLLSGRPDANATAVRMLGSMRDLPGLVGVQIVVRSGSAPFTATVSGGSDLPALATTLAGALPDGKASWLNGPLSASVKDPAGHRVTVVERGLVSASDTRAFALAVHLDPAHAATLTVSGGSGTARRSLIRLTSSPQASQVVTALHRAGYGLSRRGEVVEGPVGQIAMDEKAWATSVAADLRRRTGALAATVDPGSAEPDRPVTADLRIPQGTSFDRFLEALPSAVEQVALHTSVAAPDYARDDALAPDPEVDCPAADSGLNLAYTGPPSALPKAANYVSALRGHAAGATCVHWAERGQGTRPTTQTLLVRLPLREQSWRPVLDVIRARRADLGSAHPAVVLLLPVPGTSVTGVLNLAEGQAPYASALDPGGRAELRQTQDALQPLVQYWTRG